jgi:putative DNA methylase
MPAPKKLIESALPVKEISSESVRDKSIRHGHISTLHLWWARRPLPVCRAVVFASLVPDPLDPNCPQAFRDAVELLLGKDHNPGDPYRPYADIPWTAVYDPMEDNLRNRLQMFIGRFSPEAEQAMLQKKPMPPAGKVLSDFSLIKWDNKNNEAIINKARKLIWVAHGTRNAESGMRSAVELLADFDNHYAAIKTAEAALYAIPDRHLSGPDIEAAETALRQAIEAFLDKMPRVFDPFAGGGAIPLEAARLGCCSYGNDINPVAHIIQKGSLEFPQKYGKPITYTRDEFIRRYGQAAWDAQPNENKTYHRGDATAVRIANRLSFDVEFYARELLRRAEAEIGHYYPADEKGNKPIAYYWARVGTCSNPSCRAEVPLLKGFYLCNKPDKQVHLKPVIKGKDISFEVKNGSFEMEGWAQKSSLKCPACGNVTDQKEIMNQLHPDREIQRLLAVIEDGNDGKVYRLPTLEEVSILEQIPKTEAPKEKLPNVTRLTGGFIVAWGYSEWGQMFTSRQLLALHSLVEKLKALKVELESNESDYGRAVATYLGILVDRGSAITTSFGRWDTSRENVQSPFSRQAIPMIFDFPEANILGKTTGSLNNQLEWITRYVESESVSSFVSICNHASSGDKTQFDDKYLAAVVTDPPYYDAIAYADLSDFFYVWLKRTVGYLFPLNFTTPQTPKSEECTALKHHHKGKVDLAKRHFEDKLLQIFDAIEHQTSDIVSIMFAHQSTEAWTTLCNSILGARMNITGSWAMDTEMANRSISLAGAALESSVTVSCRPSQRQGIGDFKTVKKAIEERVTREVEHLYTLGFRGADLLTACFGQAVSEFGQYQAVEKADGSRVTVADLLEMARESAFNALLKGFQGDDFTKFYIAWLQLYGFTESDFDDAAKFSRVGLTINVQDLFREHILLKSGNKQSLGGYEARLAADKKLGDSEHDILINKVHRALHLYRGANRGELLRYLARVAANPTDSFWRVLTSLCEVLPAGSEDLKQAQGLLTNKDSLLRECQEMDKEKPTQTQLDL